MWRRARERVLEVVAEQGYEPNPNAKNLKLTTRTSIAVVVKGAHNLLFGEILEHIQSALSAAEESTQIIYIDEDANEVQEALRMNRSARFKGTIFLGGVPAHFIEDSPTSSSERVAHQLGGEARVQQPLRASPPTTTRPRPM